MTDENATITTNYGLTKPDGTEVFNLAVFNTNSDIVDARMFERCRRQPSPPGTASGTKGDLWVDTQNNKIWQCTGERTWVEINMGGGSAVSWQPGLTSGAVVGKLTINGVENTLYCAEPGGGGSVVSWSQGLTSGSVVGDLTINGVHNTLFCKDGSAVSWQQGLTSGAVVGKLTINGIENPLFCKDGSTVSWNAGLTSGAVVGKLTINGVENTLYCMEGGGGGSTVSWIPGLTSGSVVGKLVINGVENTLYCNDGGATGDFLPRDGSKAMLGDLLMGTYRIVNLGYPQLDADATTKKYVDERVVVKTTGTSHSDVRYIVVGGTEYRLAAAVSGTYLLKNETGSFAPSCPSRSGFLNVLGYFASVYYKTDVNKVIVNGVEHENGETFNLGPHSVKITYAYPIFSITCPIGSTFLQDQSSEDSWDITGAISPYVKNNATPLRVFWSNEAGKMETSPVPNATFLHLQNVRSDIQEQIDSISHGVAVNLNGRDVETKATFYAPTTYGEPGRYLKADGINKEPIWAVPPGNPMKINGVQVPSGTEVSFYAPTTFNPSTHTVLKSNGEAMAPTWAYLYKMEYNCVGYMVEGTASEMNNSWGDISTLDSADFLIIRCTDNGTPSRLWDEVIFHPIDYDGKFWYKRWERDGDEMYAELKFTYKNRASKDIVEMTHSVRVEIVKIIAVKLGPINA